MIMRVLDHQHDLGVKCQDQVYSRTSMARTLMDHSPWLERTITMVPKGHFMHDLPRMAGITIG